MTNLKVVLWNSAGLRSITSSTTQRLAFFDKEFKHTNFDVAIFVETHHKADSIFPQEIKIYFEEYYVIHTPATKKHTHVGIIILINKIFQISKISAVDLSKKNYTCAILLEGAKLGVVIEDDIRIILSLRPISRNTFLYTLQTRKGCGQKNVT